MKKKLSLAILAFGAMTVLPHAATAQISDSMIYNICMVESDMVATSARMFYGAGVSLDEAMEAHPEDIWPAYTREVMTEAWRLYDHPNFSEDLTTRIIEREARIKCEAALRQPRTGVQR